MGRKSKKPEPIKHRLQASRERNADSLFHAAHRQFSEAAEKFVGAGRESEKAEVSKRTEKVRNTAKILSGVYELTIFEAEACEGVERFDIDKLSTDAAKRYTKIVSLFFATRNNFYALEAFSLVALEGFGPPA